MQARPSASGGRRGFDLLDHLRGFLSDGPTPILLVMGPAGSGKSTLLQTLVPMLPGPKAFIAYHAEGQPPDSAASTAGMNLPISLVLIDATPGAPPASDSADEVGQSMSFAPATARQEEAFPEALREVEGRIAAQGHGLVVVDSWDQPSEAALLRLAGPGAVTRRLQASAGVLRGQFGRSAAPMLLTQGERTDPTLISIADGVVELGWEQVEGFALRVVTIPKMRRSPVPETRYLYTLQGGVFRCPPQHPPGFQPPIAPPDPDPEPEAADLFPGSVAFADAFGRLRAHSVTGLEFPASLPSRVESVFLLPLVAHTLSTGGRVAWIPAPTSGPAQAVSDLAKMVPRDFVRERLRIVTAGASEEGLGEMRSVALPVRREGSKRTDVREPGGPSVGPMFPDVYAFLRGTPEGRPSLFVVSLDGLQGLTAAAGITVTPATFPVVIGVYARLPRFHGFGFGRSEDPLARVIIPNLDTHLRVVEKYGRNVLLGIRPRTTPFILDWTDPTGRYSLVPIQ